MGKLQDKGILSWVCFMYSMVMCMLVIVVLPIVVGAWSMPFLLRQRVEYNIMDYKLRRRVSGQRNYSTVLVVSPLVSLMVDQVTSLRH